MTQAIVVDAAAKKEAEAESAGARDYLALVRDTAIVTDADAEAAVELAREVKDQIKRIEKTKKFFVDPLRKVLNTYNSYFSEPLDVLKKVERDLKDKLAAFVRAKDARNQLALAEAASTKDPEKASAALATITPAANPAGTSIRYRWVFEVTDADAVPRQYCSPDDRKIGEAFAVGEGGKPMEIPGVAWRQEPIVSVRKR